MIGSRSSLEALDATRRRQLREGALTRAQQGLRRPMVDLEHAGQAILDQRGTNAGTYNGRGPGTSASDGAELLANVITNGLEARQAQMARKAKPLRPMRGTGAY